MNPLQVFAEWYQHELAQTTTRIPSVCCLSTMGLDGFPNARFVSLKEILDEKLIVTGQLNSRKGIEIQALNKVALTFWWGMTEKQVRIQGIAELISGQTADRYFAEREKETQLVAWISKQGTEMDSLENLRQKYQTFAQSKEHENIARPETWGGYAITPVRIELMTFLPNRLHERTLYERVEGKWRKKYLQP